MTLFWTVSRQTWHYRPFYKEKSSSIIIFWTRNENLDGFVCMLRPGSEQIFVSFLFLVWSFTKQLCASNSHNLLCMERATTSWPAKNWKHPGFFWPCSSLQKKKGWGKGEMEITVPEGLSGCPAAAAGPFCKWLLTPARLQLFTAASAQTEIQGLVLRDSSWNNWRSDSQVLPLTF